MKALLLRLRAFGDVRLYRTNRNDLIRAVERAELGPRDGVTYETIYMETTAGRTICIACQSPAALIKPSRLRLRSDVGSVSYGPRSIRPRPFN